MAKEEKRYSPEEIMEFQKQDKPRHQKWLHFIIEDKKQMLKEFADKPRAVRVLKREIDVYQKMLEDSQGMTPMPSKYDDMSPMLKSLHDTLINKQIALVACKENINFCDRLKIEIRQIEIEISKQERLEGVNKQEEVEIPF